MSGDPILLRSILPGSKVDPVEPDYSFLDDDEEQQPVALHRAGDRVLVETGRWRVGSEPEHKVIEVFRVFQRRIHSTDRGYRVTFEIEREGRA